MCVHTLIGLISHKNDKRKPNFDPDIILLLYVSQNTHKARDVVFYSFMFPRQKSTFRNAHTVSFRSSCSYIYMRACAWSIFANMAEHYLHDNRTHIRIASKGLKDYLCSLLYVCLPLLFFFLSFLVQSKSFVLFFISLIDGRKKAVCVDGCHVNDYYIIKKSRLQNEIFSSASWTTFT